MCSWNLYTFEAVEHLLSDYRRLLLTASCLPFHWKFPSVRTDLSHLSNVSNKEILAMAAHKKKSPLNYAFDWCCQRLSYELCILCHCMFVIWHK